MKIKKNLVLLGMMGVGKTRIGKYVAKRLKINFFDIDKLVEIKNEMKMDGFLKATAKKQLLFPSQPKALLVEHLLLDAWLINQPLLPNP